MNALAQKYTEEQYLTYDELKKRFLPAQMEAIWKEITAYRDLFTIMLFDQSWIVYGVSLQQRHAKAERLMNRMLRENTAQNFNQEQLGLSHQLLEQVKRKYDLQYSLTLKAYAKELQIEYSELMQYLDEHDLPLLMQVYVILIKSTGWLRQVLLLYVSYESASHDVIFMLAQKITNQEMNDSKNNDMHLKSGIETNIGASQNQDLTNSYHQWLNQVYSWLQDQLQAQREQYNKSYLQELRLLERYPQLKPYQAEFFEQHRSPGHYYTVEQFLLYCNTCYETARMGMEDFVRLGWYKKKKVGKKFVYTVNN